MAAILPPDESDESMSSTIGQSLAAPYLTVPTRDPDPVPEEPTSPSPVMRKDRLYIGNLHPTVDEYSLLQIFQKYGRVSHLDFLFHRAGALKGKPRGYAFLEYVDKEDALKALVELNDRPIRGRKLVVTFANQAPIDLGGQPVKRAHTDTSRPTALSLLKSSSKGGGKTRTEDLIRKMEAKLDQMNKDKSPVDDNLPPRPEGLPDKPSLSVIRAAELGETQRAEVKRNNTTNTTPAPAPANSNTPSQLPAPKKHPAPTVRDLATSSSGATPHPPLQKSRSLAGARALSGVRIVKHKSTPVKP